jgi:hypothetical protein
MRFVNSSILECITKNITSKDIRFFFPQKKVAKILLAQMLKQKTNCTNIGRFIIYSCELVKFMAKNN